MDGGLDISAVMIDDPPMTLESLPDDALRSIYVQLYAQASELYEPMRLLACCRRFLALSSSFVQELELSSARSHGMLRLPHAATRGFQNVLSEASLLAPYAWAARLSGLRVLELAGPSWSAAARLMTLLRAWPALEQLELRFHYSHATFEPIVHPFQTLVDELAEVLRGGALPALRYVWLGCQACKHSFGQRYADGRGSELDDRALLEELQPTAALWWMAERAEHVRCSRMHQFRYELEHGADVHAVFGSMSIVQWMRERLRWQWHSRAGHRAVHRLLVQFGAAAAEPFVPIAESEQVALSLLDSMDGLAGDAWDEGVFEFTDEDEDESEEEDEGADGGDVSP